MIIVTEMVRNQGTNHNPISHVTAKTNRNVEIVETKTMTQQAAPTTWNAQDVETHTQHGTSNAANEMKKEAD